MTAYPADGFADDRDRLVQPLSPEAEAIRVSSDEHRRLTRDRVDPLPEHFEPGPNPHLEPRRRVPSSTTKQRPRAEDEEPEPRMHFVRASEVTVRRPRFVWTDRIPLGGVSIVAGREGQGKSALLTYLMARLTRGQLPGEFQGVPSDVLYIGSEDDRSSVIVPRLITAGADLERVRFLDMDRGTFSIGVDLDELERMLGDSPGVRLIVADPIDSHLGDRVDTHRKSEVQAALADCARMAQESESAFAGVCHLNKGESRELLSRMVGSVGFSTSARSVLGVGPHPEDETERVVVLAKSNYRDKLQVPAQRFRVEGGQVDSGDGPIVTAAVVWLGEQDGIDPDSIVAGMGSVERTERSEAADWLNDLLGDGPMAYKEIERAARDDGIARATLHRAKALVGIDVSRDVNERGRPSTWSLSSQPESSQSLRETGETKPKPAVNRDDVPDDGVSSLGLPVRDQTIPDTDPVTHVTDETQPGDGGYMGYTSDGVRWAFKETS